MEILVIECNDALDNRPISVELDWFYNAGYAVASGLDLLQERDLVSDRPCLIHYKPVIS